MFSTRATKPERIDTGDYTAAEYARFMKEIRVINQRLGDKAALEATLLADIEKLAPEELSVLDVGAGTGELLGVIAEHSRAVHRRVRLVGLDLNEKAADEIARESAVYDEIAAVRGDALRLPFADDTFDYAICSLFTHHLGEEQIPAVLREMSRVARRGIVVIDLERSAAAWALFQLYCLAFRISPLVRQDGSLSIRKGFRLGELSKFADSAGLNEGKEVTVRPYRVVYTRGLAQRA